MFTIGYDQCINGYGKSKELFFHYKNPNKCLFTSIAWDGGPKKVEKEGNQNEDNEDNKLLYFADE